MLKKPTPDHLFHEEAVGDRRSFLKLIGPAIAAGGWSWPAVTPAADARPQAESGRENASPRVLEYIERPSVEDMGEILERWQRKYPSLMRSQIRGKSGEGRPLYLMLISDFNVPAEDKQVVLLTATHAGAELSSTANLFYFAKWLLSDDPAAAESRRKQLVLIMPCGNPDGYAKAQGLVDLDKGREWNESTFREMKRNAFGSNPYVSWTWEGVREPEKNPEAVSLHGLMEEFQPDVHVDVHGIRFKDTAMWESTGISWSSALNRSYIQEIPRRMAEAAEEAGFLMTYGEDTAGQVRATGPTAGADHHYYLRNSHIVAPVYTYHRYHSIAFTMEVGFAESARVQLRRLLEIGNQVWRGEHYPGYPTNQVAAWSLAGVAAYGRTAGERRKSRVELWRKLRQLQYGSLWGEPAGQAVCVCATTPGGAKKFLVAPGSVPGGTASVYIEDLLEKLAHDPRFDHEALSDFARKTRAFFVGCRGANWNVSDAEPIQNGLALRLLIPYRNAKIDKVRLDGHGAKLSPRDGYIVWQRAGGLVVQVNIPPDRVHDFHIVTCTYDPKQLPKLGFGREDW